MFGRRGIPLSRLQRDLLTHRRGIAMLISSADEFLVILTARSRHLLSRRHPTRRSKLAVATLKRYLPHESETIRVHDLMGAETQRLIDAGEDHIPVRDPLEPDAYLALLRRLER